VIDYRLALLQGQGPVGAGLDTGAAAGAEGAEGAADASSDDEEIIDAEVVDDEEDNK